MSRNALPRGFQKNLGSLRAFQRYNAQANVSAFSTSSRRPSYADTIDNLKIGAHTKVLFQGFTGRQATFNAKECIEYGTKVVGGVKPGFEGEHLGLPVLPSVRAAVDKLRPDASAIYVPGNGTVTAMEEAIEAEIPLIIAVAEHIPIHDILRIHQMLKTQSKTRLVGANCPGIINTYGRCRIGFQPLPFFQEGKIGIIAKSGTLSYETVAATTRAGLGQSYAISMGGDVLAGTNFVEAFQVFEHDDKTEGIIMVGEVGGTAEQDAAEWVREYRKRTPNPKPVMALIGGVHAPRGRIMGHAGAWAASGEADAAEKIKVLEKAGVVVVDHPEKFGDGMKKLLTESSKSAEAASNSGALQKRAFHTMRQRPRPQAGAHSHNQKRTLYLKQSQAFDMLEGRGIATIETPLTDDSHPIPDETPAPSKEHLLSVSIDRTSRSPCIIASPSTDPSDMFHLAERFPFAYGSDGATSESMLENVSKHLGMNGLEQKGLANLISNLVDIFMNKEAIMLETKFAVREDGTLQVQDAKFGFDDAAFKSSGRQKDIHALRDKDAEVREEIMAEKEGMIYVKLSGDGSLGTIVNGAGLAMNTVDALVARGGHPANFLDTGGKATSETIKAAFKCVTSDPRVKAIFVNIFGGLTLCDMIAKGIIMAFQDLDLKVPVVVRLRGTNEKLGQKIVGSSTMVWNGAADFEIQISESGLKLDAFDGFEDAAKRAIGLAQGTENI
jgi:succinyl-CoA synthetase alpha subunit